jgi:hypothetical protein
MRVSRFSLSRPGALLLIFYAVTVLPLPAQLVTTPFNVTDGNDSAPFRAREYLLHTVDK